MLLRRMFLLLLLVVPACTGGVDKATPSNEVAPSGPRSAGSTAAPTTGADATSATPVAPTEAWAAIRSGALLVDVRSQAEYDQGHLDGALLIPHDQMAARASELGEDKSRAIVLYCRSGNRSSQAKKALEAQGYTNVMNAGGYEGLKQGR